MTEKRKKSRRVYVRMTEDEYAMLTKKIRRSGKSMQQYCSDALLNAEVVNTDGIREFLPELNRLGNNLNQIAKALNGTGYYNYRLITENQKEVEDLWLLLRQYLQKLQ